MPVIEDLKSLVLASPNYHQSYLTVRHGILEWHAKQQYGDGESLDLAEALTAVRSKGVHFTDKREAAIALLDSWRRRHEIRELCHPSPSRLDKVENVEEAIELLRFHKQLSFFLNDYSINAPKPLDAPDNQWWNKSLPLSFSALEKRRILRALCRLQIMKNIFGDTVYCLKRNCCEICGSRPTWQFGETTKKVRASERLDFDRDAIKEYAFRLFYGTMPPWEYQEMACVFTYLRAKVQTVLDDMANEFRLLMKDTPDKWFCDVLPKEERPPEGLEIDGPDDLPRMTRNSKGIAALGPEFLFRILHMDGPARRNLVITNFRDFWPGPWIGHWLEVPFKCFKMSSLSLNRRINFICRGLRYSGLLYLPSSNQLLVGRKHGSFHMMSTTILGNL